MSMSTRTRRDLAEHHQRRRQARRATMKAATHHYERQSASQAEFNRAGSMPRPGDTFLSRRTADFPVEWLVLDQDGSRCQVLAMDEFPLVGSADCPIPSQNLGSSQIGRCAYTTWLDAGSLEHGLHTGRFSESQLGAVRRKHHAFSHDSLVAKLSEEEVDGDPEYLFWCEQTLGPALAALAQIPRSRPAPANDNASTSVAGWPWRRIAPVAALFLLVILPAGLAVSHLLESLEVERDGVATLQEISEQNQVALKKETSGRLAAVQQVGDLENELQKLQDSFEAGRVELVRSYETQMNRLKSDLIQATAARIIENIPILRLDGRSRRSTRSTTRSFAGFTLGDTSQVVIEVDVEDPEPYETYKACFTPARETEFCLEDLVLQSGRFLRIAVPAEHLKPDDYEVSLEGRRRGTSTPLDEQYDVRIEP